MSQKWRFLEDLIELKLNTVDIVQIRLIIQAVFFNDIKSNISLKINIYSNNKSHNFF